jgi:thiamine-phosphate pyrophosphorylase
VTRRSFDLSLYLVTDETLADGRSMGQIVRSAIEGGVTAVQIREKTASTLRFVDNARTMRSITAEAGVSLIVNDRIDVALAVDADGVHVGQEDMPAAVARGLIGGDRILGVTASNAKQAREAARAGADYIGCSAVFGTPTKVDTGVPLGLRGLERLVSASPLPVVAIGGINPGNVRAVMGTGVVGVAVVSAIVAAADPRADAEQIRKIVTRSRAENGGQG